MTSTRSRSNHATETRQQPLGALTQAESGIALISGIFVTTALLFLISLYTFEIQSKTKAHARSVDLMRARVAAEEGVHRAVAELLDDTDPGGDGIGNLSYVSLHGDTVTVTAQLLYDNRYNIEARVKSRKASFGVGSVFALLPRTFNPKLPGAIVSRSSVDLLGNITIDGTEGGSLTETIMDDDWDDWEDQLDYEYSGEDDDDDDDDHNSNENSRHNRTSYSSNTSGSTTETTSEPSGVVSGGSVTLGGSATVGADDKDPRNPPPPGSIEETWSWADGVDNDGDGLIDEEAYDGIDNDGDGRIDEDVNEFPQSPDAVVEAPVGTLKTAAQEMGTYFTSQAALDAYVTANGGNVPGGIILYADFPLWQPVELGASPNILPSIIVHDYSGGPAVMKNVHGSFRGLILADDVIHINGTFTLLGAIVAFAPQTTGNAFGTGDAQIAYSSVALTSLPAPGKIARDLLWWLISSE